MSPGEVTQMTWSAVLRPYEQMSDQLARVEAERNELARQLEEARRLACHYAELLHKAHRSEGIIEPDWLTGRLHHE